MTQARNKWNIAFYRNNKFAGMVANFQTADRNDAETVAGRYCHAYPGRDYRAVFVTPEGNITVR